MDNATNKQKETVWVQLAHEFNMQSTEQIPRTALQLQNCWKTIKREARKRGKMKMDDSSQCLDMSVEQFSSHDSQADDDVKYHNSDMGELQVNSPNDSDQCEVDETSIGITASESYSPTQRQSEIPGWLVKQLVSSTQNVRVQESAITSGHAKSTPTTSTRPHAPHRRFSESESSQGNGKSSARQDRSKTPSGKEISGPIMPTMLQHRASTEDIQMMLEEENSADSRRKRLREEDEDYERELKRIELEERRTALEEHKMALSHSNALRSVELLDKKQEAEHNAAMRQLCMREKQLDIEEKELKNRNAKLKE